MDQGFPLGVIPAEALTEEDLCPDRLLRGQEAAYARDIARLQAAVSGFCERPCPACGANQAKRHFEKYSFTFVRCEKCATLYMSPCPSPELMAEYYRNSENYRYWAEHIFPATEDARRDKIHKGRLERIVRCCRKYGTPMGALLEIGPGFGTFALLAESGGLFSRVRVVEPTPELAACCRQRGLEVVEQRVEDLPENFPRSDVLIAFEVIEHLFDPALFIAKTRRLLSAEGLLVLTCPNGAGFDIQTLGPLSPAVDSEHVNLFNPASLAALVEGLGFNVLEVVTPGRLDAELVREAALKGDLDLRAQPFLRRVLLEEWESLGPPFQHFLAGQGLSSHMWLIARKGERP